MSWLEKMSKILKVTKIEDNTFSGAPNVSPVFTGVTTTTPSPAYVSNLGNPNPNTPTLGSMMQNTVASHKGYSSIGNSVFGIYSAASANIVRFHNSTNKEIVRLNADGSVTWNDEIKIDEAAEAFSQSLRVGAELSSGITKRVKLEMRDSVFNDIIAIAKEKGPLSAEDLTSLLEASKIVEKLKGGSE